MTDAPPLAAPSVQVKPTCAELVIAGTLAKLIGASGTVKITASLPLGEISELPLIFVAITRA